MGLEEELNQLFFGIKETLWAVVIIAVLILIIFVIILLERKFKRMIELRKKSRNFYYRERVKELNKLVNSKKALEEINFTSKNFFKEAFNLPYDIGYSELIEEFRKTGKKECVSFCEMLLNLNYSGEEIKEEQTKAVIKLLERIVEQNRIPGEEILEEEKRKEEERQRLIEKYKPNKIFKEKLIPKLEELRKKTQKIKLPEPRKEEEETKEILEEAKEIEIKPRITPQKRSKEIKPRITPQKRSKEKTTKSKRRAGEVKGFDSMSSIQKKIEKLKRERRELGK